MFVFLLLSALVHSLVLARLLALVILRSFVLFNGSLQYQSLSEILRLSSSR